MTTSTQAPQRGPKHRARTPRWPRLTALVASASMIGLLTAGSLALQPASAVQDATTPADVNLMPEPATCDDFGCNWMFRPANDAYSFALARDSAVAGGMLMVDVQSAEVIPGFINTWSARILDTNRIVIIDFMDGMPRVWTGGAIALQASPAPNEPATLSPSAISALKQLQQPFDPSLVGRVRIRQVIVPSVARKSLVAPTEAQVSQYGDDVSAIGQITFSEPVTGFTAGDLTLSTMSEGCRIDTLTSAGDGLNFELLIRGCTSSWMSVILQPDSLLGRAPGPLAATSLGPMQPRVVAAPAPVPTASPTPEPTATAVAAPAPAPAPIAEPVVEAPTVVETPSVVETPPVAEISPVVEPESARFVAEAQTQPARVQEQAVVSEDPQIAILPPSDPGSGVPPNQGLDASTALMAQQTSAETGGAADWLVPVAAGLATVGGLTGAAVAGQRLRGRFRKQMRLRLPRRHTAGFGAA